MKPFFSSLLLFLLPTFLFAGGIKGPLFSQELIAGFFAIVFIIYISSLIFSVLKYEKNKTWHGVVGGILTMIIFIPSLFFIYFIPFIGIPVALIMSFNIYLLFKTNHTLSNETTKN